jgi:peptide/nickel transport system substrate-binding protein
LTHYASDVSNAHTKGFKGRPYNPEKAKQLLKEAGYPNGFKTTLYATSRFPAAMSQMTAIQSYLKAVGIDAKVEIVDGGKYYKLQFKGWKDGLILFGLGATYNSIGDLDRTFQTGGFRLPSLARSTELDEMMRKAQIEPDYDKQNALIQKAVMWMHDNAMLTPLYSWNDIFAIDPSLHDARFGDNLGVSYTPADAWLAK